MERMKPRLRERWATNAAAINGWLTIPSSITAVIAGEAGFDSVTIDLQHGQGISKNQFR